MAGLEELSIEEIADNIGRKMADEPAAESTQESTPAKETPSEAAAEAPPAVETKPDEVAEAPVSEAADKQPEPAKVTPPASSPELDARVQAATKAEQEANQARDRLVGSLNHLNILVPQLENAVRGEFSDIKTQEDVLKLMQTDVDRYNRFAIAQTQVNMARQAQSAAQAEADRDARTKFEEHQKAELEKLPNLIPELKDPKTAPSHAKALQEYAFQAGYTPEQLRFASARDFQLLNKAMMNDRRATQDAAALAEANKKAAKAPPVQQPGTPRNEGNAKDERAKEQSARFAKSGRIEDLAELLAIKGI